MDLVGTRVRLASGERALVTARKGDHYWIDYGDGSTDHERVNKDEIWPDVDLPKCSPYIHHWHLRKCGGTAIRLALKPWYGHKYFEMHRRYGESRAMEVSAGRGTPSCSVRRFVVLREPYTQLLSELDHFPASFVSADGAVSIRDNHFVCGGVGVMGLCRSGKCNVSEALQVLSTFDYVGFAEHLDDTFEVLKGWVNCSRGPNRTSEGLGTAAVLHALELGRRRFAAGRVTDSDPRRRLAAPHQALRDTATRQLARVAIEGAPSRAEFRRRHACAVALYESARPQAAVRATRGLLGAPTAQPLRAYVMHAGAGGGSRRGRARNQTRSRGLTKSAVCSEKSRSRLWYWSGGPPYPRASACSYDRSWR